MTEASWLIDVFPGKDPVRLNGTIQEIYEQALALNPDFPKLNATITAPPDFRSAGPTQIKGTNTPLNDSPLKITYSPVADSSLGRNPEDFTGNSLVKRDYTKCYNHEPAYAAVIQSGINYLRGISPSLGLKVETRLEYLLNPFSLGIEGRPRLDGGFATCSRVSCSYNSAIVWCNDVRKYLTRLTD
jgi:hypothetical protein